MKKVTVYLPDTLAEQIGECRSLSARIIELVGKGLEYETTKLDKITLKDALGFIAQYYQKKYGTVTVPHE